MNNINTIEGVKNTIFGSGSIMSIGNECKKLGASRVLVVIDKVLSRSIIAERVKESLKSARIKFFIFPDITPEPAPKIADLGKELAMMEKVQCVIGVGGGSTMDIAKAIAMLTRNEGNAIEYIGLDKVKKPGIPTIMIPTTAGTGSETTLTALFTQRDTKKKAGIHSHFLYPHAAILDPELTIDLPPTITAYTGMYALTNAIESYTSLNANFMSEIVSLKAIELIMDNLRGAVFDGKNMKYRENMMMGSYLAGMGLSMAGGVGAVQAMTYPMCALVDVPHGIGNGLLLPYVLEYNYPGNIDKFCNIALCMDHEMGDLSRREYASLVVEAVFELAQDIGLPMTLKELNLPEESIPEMAKVAMQEVILIANNPRPMTLDAIMKIYRNAYEG